MRKSREWRTIVTDLMTLDVVTQQLHVVEHIGILVEYENRQKILS